MCSRASDPPTTPTQAIVPLLARRSREGVSSSSGSSKRLASRTNSRRSHLAHSPPAVIARLLISFAIYILKNVQIFFSALITSSLAKKRQATTNKDNRQPYRFILRLESRLRCISIRYIAYLIPLAHSLTLTESTVS